MCLLFLLKTLGFEHIWSLCCYPTPLLFRTEVCRPCLVRGVKYIPRGAGSLEEFDFCVCILRLIQFILASSFSSPLSQGPCGAEHPHLPTPSQAAAKASLVQAEHPLEGAQPYLAWGRVSLKSVPQTPESCSLSTTQV